MAACKRLVWSLLFVLLMSVPAVSFSVQERVAPVFGVAWAVGNRVEVILANPTAERQPTALLLGTQADGRSYTAAETYVEVPPRTVLQLTLPWEPVLVDGSFVDSDTVSLHQGSFVDRLSVQAGLAAHPLRFAVRPGETLELVIGDPEWSFVGYGAVVEGHSVPISVTEEGNHVRGTLRAPLLEGLAGILRIPVRHISGCQETTSVLVFSPRMQYERQ